jgi:hypothetical protein
VADGADAGFHCPTDLDTVPVAVFGIPTVTSYLATFAGYALYLLGSIVEASIVTIDPSGNWALRAIACSFVSGCLLCSIRLAPIGDFANGTRSFTCVNVTLPGTIDKASMAPEIIFGAAPYVGDGLGAGIDPV